MSKTNIVGFYKMEFEEVQKLKIGDEIAICLKLNPPEKVEFVGAKVTRPLFWNSDADEPGWELETNNGFVDPDSVWGVTTPCPVKRGCDKITYLEINKLNEKEKGELLDKVEKLIEEAVANLEGQEDYIYGGDERSNDLMDCGYADGNYDAWYEVLELLGVKHHFKDNRT